jgi:hypothetical protein
MRLQGWPSITIRRGEVVYDAAAGQLAEAGGQFVPTDPAHKESA